MIELFTGNNPRNLRFIGKDFAKIIGMNIEGPYVCDYKEVIPVEDLKVGHWTPIYEKYVNEAKLSGFKYGIQLEVKLLCGL